MTPIPQLFSDLPDYWKLSIAALTGLGAFFADASPEIRGWEELGMKGLLIAALVFVVKLLLRQQAEHKEETGKREERLLAHIEKSTIIQSELLEATKRQTGYFETVTRNIVNERLGERHDIEKLAKNTSINNLP